MGVMTRGGRAAARRLARRLARCGRLGRPAAAPTAQRHAPRKESLTLDLDDEVLRLQARLNLKRRHVDGLLIVSRDDGRAIEVGDVQVTGAEGRYEVSAAIDLHALADHPDLAESTLDLWFALGAVPGADGELGAPTRMRVGTFAEVQRPPRGLWVDAGATRVRADVTVEGNLSIRVGTRVEDRIRYVPLALTIDEGRLFLRGEVVSRNTPIVDARLDLRGRTRSAGVTLPVRLRWAPSASAARRGTFVYDVSAEVDLQASVPTLLLTEEETIELALLLDVDGEGEPIRRGITPVAGRTATLRSAALEREGTVHLLVPYFTFRSHRLTMRVERFASADYAFMRRLQRVGWLFPLVRPFTRVWLVGEVPYKAQDNGLAFFRHVRTQHPRRRAYYVIDRESPDYESVAAFGNVVTRWSRQHILATFLASRIICSHHSEHIWASRDAAVARYVRGVRIFLQHGPTAMKNVVPNYGRQTSYERPAERFLVVSELEKRIVVEDYGYAPRQVRVTGFARYDTLFTDDVAVQPTVLVMPTWRENLIHEDAFVQSRFVDSWHGLLSDRRVQQALRAQGMSVTFVLHPNLRHHAHLLKTEQVRVVAQGDEDVQRLIKTSAVLITDFSSVAWDFAFLRKPVVYFQFDRRDLQGSRTPHIDFDTMLPGPVALDLGEAISALVQVLQGGARMSEEHLERADRFLARRDRQNCARIYEVVRKAWRPSTVLDRVRNAVWVQHRWHEFRRSSRYLPLMFTFYRLARHLPKRDTVVFGCDRGAHYGDSPRYLYERLLARRTRPAVVWVSNTPQRFLDPATHKVARYTPRYFWLMARARWWIDNQNIAVEMPPSRRTAFLQTWHGTPLKKLQNDVAVMHGRRADYLTTAARQVGFWDALVSPSPYATAVFRSAFGYEGPVIEAGYPRNDLFAWPDAAERARLARRRLGIPADVRVILYAPTFRDDRRNGNRWSHKEEWDLERFAREHGHDSVLLVRHHPLVRASLPSDPDVRQAVVDVSRYQDVQELLLIADVLVTDYSSVFFDYVNLDRPILFFTYDLEHFADDLRGFYLDPAAVAPGPLLRDSDALFAALADLDNVNAAFAARRRDLRATYAPWDDGGASDRVLDAFLGPDRG